MKTGATLEQLEGSSSESTLTSSETDDDESSSGSSTSSSVDIPFASDVKTEGDTTYYEEDDIDWFSQLRSSPLFKYRYEEGHGPEAADDQANGRPGSRSSQVSSRPSSMTSYYMCNGEGGEDEDGEDDDDTDVCSEPQSAKFCTPPESQSPLPEGNWSAPNFPRMPPEGEESASVYHVTHNNSSDDIQKLTLTPLSKSCSTSYMSDSEIASTTTTKPAIKVHRSTSSPGPSDSKFQPVGARFLSQQMSLSNTVQLSLYSHRSRSQRSAISSGLPTATRGSKYI